MTVIASPRRLDPDPEAAAELRAALDRLGYDDAQQWFRPDYFVSPFPHRERFLEALGNLPAPLATALRLFALADPVGLVGAERDLGRGVVEAGLAIGLLVAGGDGTVDSGGFSVVSRLGCYAVVSTNPYYPGFRPDNADVYVGPDSFALAAQLDRLAAVVPTSGTAADLCCGSGIAGQGLATRMPGLAWTGVDLAPPAVEAAALNAALNGLGDRYRPVVGDLYGPLGGARFDLIVCNPPFIPVPAGPDFPGYGAGGDDGLAVLRPLFDGLRRHLSDGGRAVVYAEGIGDAEGPAVRAWVEEVARRDGLDAELLVVAAASREQALYALGRLLANQKPSRLTEVGVWAESFSRQRVDGYFKYFVVARPGRGSFRVKPLVQLVTAGRP
jgi:hypothetical protein